MHNKWKLGGMMLASLLTVASCQNEDIVSNEQVQGNYSLVVTNGVDSRTYVESDGTVNWSKGDKMLVYGTNVSGTLTLQGEGGETTGTFTGFVSGNPGNLKWAVFGNNVKKTSNGATFTIDEISNPNSNSPMAGEIKDGEVNLNHLCGMVRITINDLPSTASVKLRGDDIAGTGEWNGTTMTVTDAKDEITIKVTDTEDPTIEVPVFATANKVDKKFTLTVDGATYPFTAPIAIGSLSEKAILALTCVVGENGKVTGFSNMEVVTTKETLQDVINSSEPGATIVIAEDIADVAVTVNKSLTITGDATLNDVSITASGTDVELTVSELNFTGNSWIGADNAKKLTVSGVTANALTTSNGSATNSRSAFISLGSNEGYTLELVIENSNIVVPEGTDVALGWAQITKATITGNTFGSADNYIKNADAIKFMSIADAATFTITGNTVYSEYNGFVFYQNTTIDNAYTVIVDDNDFYGSADHIWIEVKQGATTTHATIQATSNNTVNGNTFTAQDIKSTSRITTWTNYAGVDVVTDASGKLTGGTFVAVNEDCVADGYTVTENSDGTWTVSATTVSSAEELKTALTNGKSVVLAKSIENVDSEKYYGNASALLQMTQGGTLDGNNNTIAAKGEWDDTYDTVIYTTGGTIKNVTIDGAMRGIFSWGLTEDLIIDKVTFKNVVYTINDDASNGYAIKVTNSVLNGWTSWTSGHSEVSFTDCKFGEGMGNAFLNAHQSVTFTDCEFAEGFKVNPANTSTYLTFANCTYNGVLITAENIADVLYAASDAYLCIFNND